MGKYNYVNCLIICQSILNKELWLLKVNNNHIKHKFQGVNYY